MPHTPFPERGLYVITDSRLLPDDATLMRAVGDAIAGGARAVQFRDKSSDRERRERQARALLAMCRCARVPLLVNDDVDLAIRIGADGVHVGADDAAPSAAREQMGTDAIIGVSCYSSLALAKEAVKSEADYVAFGSFFASATKPEAATAPAALLPRVRAHLPCPVVAIGGITADNGASLVAAGADVLAVVSAVFGSGDGARAAAQRLADLF